MTDATFDRAEPRRAHGATGRPRRLQGVLLAVVAAAAGAIGALAARAEDSSAPAFLQMFEAKWETIENRMPDIFAAGYGRMWLPPPARADSGNQSVGYDVFDRFDLGQPRNETLYGTELGLKTLVRSAHAAGVLVNTDFIPNHNGFSNLGTVDTQGTATTSDDVTFAQSGGYPGFALTLPSDVDGDFHGAFQGGEEFFRLSGLIDIAQEKNHQFIRSPVTPGNPQNIPAGSSGIFGRPPANVPNPANARFYTDEALGGTTVYDPRLNQNVTIRHFNTANPLAGDAVPENATGLLMRNARWMLEEIGVDGFRIDAGRHFPRWVLDFLDQGMYLGKTQPLLDGSVQHPFTFIETGYDTPAFMQGFIRKDINNANPAQLGGNRDALDFNLFGALHGNLTENGAANNWHSIKNASIDLNDDGLRNGSQGVSFAQSHDELGPALQNVAYAYTLMMPGNAIVYTNAREFGNGRDFPRGGKDDALGGFYGETVATLVELRNSHGRGNFRERWIDPAFSNVYVYERSQSAVVALNSRNDSFVETRSNVATDFAQGTVLVELTGNAADPAVDPGDVIPQAIRVKSGGLIDLKIPSNQGHGRGYVIYGVAPPEGTLSLTGVTQTLAGATPTAANNGTARLSDIQVVTGDSFSVQLTTTAVTLPAPAGEGSPVRDVHADGDTAMIRIDGGVDVNGIVGIDDTTPGSVGYGFENFTTQRTPGYIWNGSSNVGSGTGSYAQTIDATKLAEGRHYVTVRAFRHRNAGSGGDGGPAVFTDFKRTVYVDRLKPQAQVVSFAPFASSPANQANRDLVVRSVDGTADNMHFFLDLGAAVTDAQILQMVQQGQGDAADYDRDSFISGFFGLRTGNHVATVVTIEPTGNANIQRFAGLYTQTGIGAGFGDMNGNGVYQTNEIMGSGALAFSQLLYGQDAVFHAAADVDGDGRITNLDLFALGDHLTAGGASAAVMSSYNQLLLKRGDVNGDGATTAADAAALYANFGAATWLMDLNVDGTVNIGDVSTLITELVRTSPADFNLDGRVDGADFVAWQAGQGATGQFQQGDATLNGVIDGADLAVWRTQFGVLAPVSAYGAVLGVAEPSAASLAALGAIVLGVCNGSRRRRAAVRPRVPVKQQWSINVS
ncbi:MAG TPA: dockerin type I domain-containing protein [Lacipirellulaceae bacterium]|nr:dockerin type I domain-containing protein [Lacipirellulaceae bacterium]